ncbi:MAG: hypothetical protein WKG01_01585 [Kofleriaceae bacterium]
MADTLDVLRCTGCDAPIPLGTGDVARCAFCNAETLVPPAYRALREAEATDAAHRATAVALVRQVGTPPSLPLRMFAATWNIVFFVFVGLPVVVIGGLLLGQKLLGLWGFLTKRHVHDVLLGSFGDPAAATIALGFASTTLLFGAWSVAASYGGRKAQRLRALQAGLAAKPPARPGGAKSCRVCGAPLEVPAGALAASCLYCHADNLVAIPPQWIAKAAASASQLGKAIEDASRSYFAQLRSLRRSLYLQLGVLAVLGGGLTALFFGFATSARGPHRDHDWHRDIQAPSLRRDARYQAGLVGKLSVDNRPELVTGACTPDGRNQALRFSRTDCGKEGCVVQLYVPLRRDDQLVVRGTTLPWKTLAAFYVHDGDRPFDQPNWGTRLGKPAWVGGDRETTFRASADGWYMLWIAALEGGVPLERYQLCVRLVRP